MPILQARIGALVRGTGHGIHTQHAKAMALTKKCQQLSEVLLKLYMDEHATLLIVGRLE